MTAIKVEACCKINLGLNVVSKRSDGYHDLETIFYPIPLTDEMVLSEADTDGISLCGHPLEGHPADNLVLRSIRLLRDSGYTFPFLHVSLDKRIPSGAGLGGGSSDASAVMKSINEAYRLGLSIGEMERLVSRLGADCPFFVRCIPAFAQGIGDVLTPLDFSLKGTWLVLVKPDDFISTKEAYAMVHPSRPRYTLPELIREPLHTWRGRMVNDFEESVFPHHPVVAGIKETLYACGALYASMSGSGSSVFGLFDYPADLQASFPGCFVFSCCL